jgi:hypothetical protein
MTSQRSSVAGTDVERQQRVGPRSEGQFERRGGEGAATTHGNLDTAMFDTIAFPVVLLKSRFS